MNILILAGATLLVAGLGTGAAFADNCSQADSEKKRDELVAYIMENPGKADMVTPIQKEVEKDYGGEPPAEKRCEAVDKIMTKLKAAG